MITRLVLLLSLLFGSLVVVAQQDSMTTTGPTEARIIEGLSHEDGKVRAACARRLRDLVTVGQITIATGNMVEHELAYWEGKVPRWPYRIKKEDFFKTFEIVDQTFENTGSDRQFFQLDNAFLLEVREGRKRVIVEQIHYRPRAVWLDPPIDYSGIWRQYYVNGQIFSESLYDNGVQIGISRTYNYEGILSWEEEYDEYGTIRLRKHYDAMGELIYEQTEDLHIIEDIIED